MLVDKYNMTMKENILYAKRNIVDSIWKIINSIHASKKNGDTRVPPKKHWMELGLIDTIYTVYIKDINHNIVQTDLL